MKKCPFCKADIEDNARFCLYCMKPLNEKEIIPPQQRKKPWWLLAVAAVVLIVVLWSLQGLIIPPSSDAGDGSVPIQSTQNASTVPTIFQTQPTTDMSATIPPTVIATDPIQIPTENSEPATRPTEPPTAVATKPTAAPTVMPTQPATKAPTEVPTEMPTQPVTNAATDAPTKQPTTPATQRPTRAPTTKPTQPTTPTQTKAPTMPTQSPTTAQTAAPTKPTVKPTQQPTLALTTTPTQAATEPETPKNEVKYAYRTARAGDDFSASYLNTGNDIVITGVAQPAADGIYDIPSYIDGKKVIAIVANAFSGSNTEVVYVPETVKTIWNGAFSGCNLTDIYFRGNAVYTEMSALTSGVTIHCSASCSDRNFRYYKNSATSYGAVWEEWNG